MIKEKISSMVKKNICQQIDISPKTLYNWENDIHIESIMRYIKLLKLLEIDPFEKLAEYEKRLENK